VTQKRKKMIRYIYQNIPLSGTRLSIMVVEEWWQVPLNVKLHTGPDKLYKVMHSKTITRFKYLLAQGQFCKGLILKLMIYDIMFFIVVFQFSTWHIEVLHTQQSFTPNPWWCIQEFDPGVLNGTVSCIYVAGDHVYLFTYNIYVIFFWHYLGALSWFLRFSPFCWRFEWLNQLQGKMNECRCVFSSSSLLFKL